MHPVASLPVPDNNVAVHWFEQSSYAIKDAGGTVILIDPYFPRQRPPDVFIHGVSPHDEATLKPDFVLLTHDHADHTCPESLKRIHKAFPETSYLGPAESGDRIARETSIPAAQVAVVTAGERRDIGTMTVAAVHAKAPEGDPDRGIGPPDVTHLGFVIVSDSVRLYISGDVFNSFAEREDLVAAVRELRPEIGFLTNHPTEGEFPFFDGSAAMAAKIGLRRAVPAHFDCFAERTYDPNDWARHFPAAGGCRPLLIPRNSTFLFPGSF